VGQKAGGKTGAVLGAGVGGAAGATIGKGVTQSPRGPSASGHDPYYRQAGYDRRGPRGYEHDWQDDHDDRRHGHHKHRPKFKNGHDNGHGHAYGRNKHRD
jgi:hypothetical protein